jgi:hypothetical protein
MKLWKFFLPFGQFWFAIIGKHVCSSFECIQKAVHFGPAIYPMRNFQLGKEIPSLIKLCERIKRPLHPQNVRARS